MQDHGQTYEDILYNPAHETEYRVLIYDKTTETQSFPSYHEVSSGTYETDYYIPIDNAVSYRIRNSMPSSSNRVTFTTYEYNVHEHRFRQVMTTTISRGNTRTGSFNKRATHYKIKYTGNENYDVYVLVYTSKPEIISQNNIVSIRREDGIFTSDTDEIKLGQVIIGQLELSILTDNKNYIPRGGEIGVQSRLILGDMATDYYPQGRYFISTRSYDKETGVLTLHAFDALRKSEKEMYTNDGDQGLWPMRDYTVLTMIATRLDVELDSRTVDVINQNYKIGFPGYKSDPEETSSEGYYTIREILGFIGAMYGGSWIISDEGRLRLIQFLDVPSAGNGYLINERGARIIFGNNAILV